MRISPATPHLCAAAARLLVGVAAALAWFGCSSGSSSNSGSGSAGPVATLPVTAAPEQARAMYDDARQVLERRCVVCHGCYDAPCRLKLEAHEGVVRGASRDLVFEPSRLLAAEPTRLFQDAPADLAGWRERGFFPMLAEGDGADPKDSVLLRMLMLKAEHPAPANTEAANFRSDADPVCPRQDEFDDFAKDHPAWGMPYAMPQLTAPEQQALTEWVLAGAPGPYRDPLTAAQRQAIERWEGFLNGDSLRQRLYARYIYEHLFFASLHFRSAPDASFFRLVRSRTPPGVPVDEIATRRPYDDPAVPRVFYRLVPRVESRLAKRQMPYLLDDARMAQYQALFEQPEYSVTELPGYDPETASNPFITFAALPIASRYRFMLKEAEYTLMGFIKGPVCYGQVALNVIQDRFWVTFVDPEVPWLAAEAEFLAKHKHKLDMPAEAGSNTALLGWRELAKHQRAFLTAKADFLHDQIEAGARITTEAIWDGDGDDTNAGLTVFRHFNSATVERGFIGGEPKTTWVIGYALLERIHYLLVAGFDVFGNAGHQLATRMYMDFMRMEAEHNFLLLLPQVRRKTLVDYWYRGADQEVRDHVYGDFTAVPVEPHIDYRSQRPEAELHDRLRARLGPALSRERDLSRVRDASLREALGRLSEVAGEAASNMPELSLLTIERADGGLTHVTVVRDSAHTNVAKLFDEDERRLPIEDHLTVVPGILGAYPNALFRVSAEQLGAFVDAVRDLRDESAYEALRHDYGVLRHHARFWAHSDRLHDDYANLDPLGHGTLDYSRLQLP